MLVPVDARVRQASGRRARHADEAGSARRADRLLTYHILPGTILAEDIGKAIDTGGGKASLATMGGGTLTATKDGDAIVLTDAAGGKARHRRPTTSAPTASSTRSTAC